MHKYLRTVGFSEYTRRSQVSELLETVESEPDRQILLTGPDYMYAQLEKDFAEGAGVASYGEYEQGTGFIRDFYFPYVQADCISLSSPCHIQKHSEKNSYSGMCDEPGLGISLIFYLNNPVEYARRRKNGESSYVVSVSLGAMSDSGKILLPVRKTPRQIEMAQFVRKNRVMLSEAARNGDEKAMETLAMDDMELFRQISDRLTREDLYSIIDTSLMPYGVECDQYSCIAEIMKVDEKVNAYTGEEMYFLLVECNGIVMRILINKKDLLGEPAVGRRFKGEIWLQGHANFVN